MIPSSRRARRTPLPRRALARPSARPPWPAPALVVVLALLLLPGAAFGQDLGQRVHETTLDNGLRILLVEQHAAPVVSFDFMFNVGGIDEPPGLGGIAHMVEHMAFKGTATIGTEHPAEERAALDRVEVDALALENAERLGDDALASRLQDEFAAARKGAQALAGSSPLDDLLSTNGAVGLNAQTGYDSTQYVVSLPSNRIELYARIYADVLANAVFRSFYEERDVVREERRQRSEDDPQGVLFEAFLAEAFQGEPYGRPLIGSGDAIAGYTATQAKAFYNAYYAPDRAVLVVVGDVDPERDMATLARYFGAVPDHATLHTRLPAPAPQTAERRVTVRFDAQPQLAVGYRKPTYPSRDAYVLDLIDALLTNGRTSRLYQRMVIGDQSALNVSTSSAFPGTREPNAFLFYALPRAPHGPSDLETALYDELQRLSTENVSERELQKVKNQVRAATIRSLDSNSGLAQNLAYNEQFAGGWEHLLEDLKIYDSITADEIRTVAARTFRPENRTVAVLLPPEGQK